METKHIPNAHHLNLVWSDTLRLPLPLGFDDGELKVAAFARDASQNDEAIGAVVVAISLAGGTHRVALKGKEQAATAGHRFPNFEIEFTYHCGGLTSLVGEFLRQPAEDDSSDERARAVKAKAQVCGG